MLKNREKEKITMDKKKIVESDVMLQVYNKLKTPYKYGAVMKFENELCDCPTVFRWGDTWYMTFIKIDKVFTDSGYETHLARSKDLLHWEYMHPLLLRNNDNSWDSRQVSAYAAFVDYNFNGAYTLKKINGKYRFSYMGGKLDGYETDPLMMGQGTFTDVCDPTSYCREKNPILSPLDEDARMGERLTLYRSDMFYDEAKTLGYTYVNAYNAKDFDQKESIFLAVSNDGEKWTRYGESAVIYDDSEEKNIRINGDPQILKMGDLYVMVYFIYKEGRAFDTFACSYDLVNWTKWKGANLIESEYEWENLYAHKPWIVVHEGVLYHYYCAANKAGERFIAVATNKKI